MITYLIGADGVASLEALLEDDELLVRVVVGLDTNTEKAFHVCRFWLFTFVLG